VPLPRATQIASMYRAQATTNKGGKKGGDEDDFW
jgi:hypothetical protein